MSLMARIRKTEKAATRSATRSIAGEHDLPVLAASENLPRAPGWESLMARGVPPSLVLGAERRSGGKR